MRRILIGVLLLGAVGVAPSTASTELDLLDQLWLIESHGLTGTHATRAGIWLATDHVYDDRGADGSRSYPEDQRYARNAADLVEVRISLAPDGLLIGVRLNAVIDPDIPIVAVGLGPGSGAAIPWPGVDVQAQGTRWVLTMTSDGGTLTDLAGGPAREVPVTVQNDTGPGQRHLENTFTATVPLSPPERGWVVVAAAGIRDGTGWDGQPFDAMLVDALPTSADGIQAAALAHGDLTALAADLDLGPDRDPVATGWVVRIHRSAFDTVLGEGIGTHQLRPLDGVEGVPVGDEFRGLFQPYSVWIPDGPAPPQGWPLFLYLHGFGGDHLNLGEWASGGIDVPAMAVSPLGRAPLGFFTGPGELDVMEALRDAQRHHPVDADRIFASGVSMGGQGTFRIAVRYPDLFAGAVPLIGAANSDRTLTPPPIDLLLADLPGGREFPGGGWEMLENLAALPVRSYNGQIDWLVNNGFVQADLLRLTQLGVDFRYAGFTARHHETVTEYTNVLYHQVLTGCDPPPPGCETVDGPGPLVRVENPARVVYKTYPEHFWPELGLSYTGAYWVSDMVVRDGAAYGLVEVTSHGLAEAAPGPAEMLLPEVRFFAPTAETYEYRGLVRPIAPGSVASRLEADLTQLAAVAFDVVRAKVDPHALTVDVTGDGRTTLGILGPYRPSDRVTVLRDGATFGDVQVSAGRLVLEAELAGEVTRFEISVVPAAEGDARPVSEGSLPATGGGLMAAAILSVLVGVAGSRRFDRYPSSRAQPRER